MAAHLVLIDALNLIRRIHAVQERPFRAQGELTHSITTQILANTTSACTSALEKIKIQLNPTHALAVFDSQAPCWRYDLYPDYKQGRSKMPEYLFNHLSHIQDAFMDLGIDSLIPEKDEADDLIATLAVKTAAKAQLVSIISTDKCFLSLLSPNIQVYDYFNRRFLDEDYVKEKYKVNVDQLIDLWTLTGDTTNKIPGVAGIGQVTASNLLNEYQNLTSLVQSNTLKDSIKSKLEESESDIKLSKKLLELQSNIPLGFNLKDIRLPH